MKALLTEIIWFEGPALIACDHRCDKAWGMNGRLATIGSYAPAQIQLSDDDDDHVNLADAEVGIAPEDTGWSEGPDGKPWFPERHNRWCARECERSSIIDPGDAVKITDYRQRVFNIPHLHDAENAVIDFGFSFQPSGQKHASFIEIDVDTSETIK
jgi:hypothetical protein